VIRPSSTAGRRPFKREASVPQLPVGDAGMTGAGGVFFAPQQALGESFPFSYSFSFIGLFRSRRRERER